MVKGIEKAMYASLAGGVPPHDIVYNQVFEQGLL
jgi:hypothetical protein